MVTALRLEDLRVTHLTPNDWRAKLSAHLAIERLFARHAVAVPRFSALKAHCLSTVRTLEFPGAETARHLPVATLSRAEPDIYINFIVLKAQKLLNEGLVSLRHEILDFRKGDFFATTRLRALDGQVIFLVNEAFKVLEDALVAETVAAALKDVSAWGRGSGCGVNLVGVANFTVFGIERILLFGCFDRFGLNKLLFLGFFVGN